MKKYIEKVVAKGVKFYGETNSSLGLMGLDPRMNIVVGHNLVMSKVRDIVISGTSTNRNPDTLHYDHIDLSMCVGKDEESFLKFDCKVYQDLKIDPYCKKRADIFNTGNSDYDYMIVEYDGSYSYTLDKPLEEYELKEEDRWFVMHCMHKIFDGYRAVFTDYSENVFTDAAMYPDSPIGNIYKFLVLLASSIRRNVLRDDILHLEFHKVNGLIVLYLPENGIEPRYQMNLVKVLADMLPNMQFIVFTNSAFIVKSANMSGESYTRFVLGPSANELSGMIGDVVAGEEPITEINKHCFYTYNYTSRLDDYVDDVFKFIRWKRSHLNKELAEKFKFNDYCEARDDYQEKIEYIKTQLGEDSIEYVASSVGIEDFIRKCEAEYPEWKEKADEIINKGK